MKKLQSTTKGTAAYFNQLHKATQSVNIAYSRNSIIAAEKAKTSDLSIQQIGSKLGKVKQGHIFGQDQITSLEKMMKRYRNMSDFTPEK